MSTKAHYCSVGSTQLLYFNIIRLMAGDLGFESRQGEDSFFFSTTSTSVLGSTQRPIPSVPGFSLSLSLSGENRRVYELTTHLQLVLKLRMSGVTTPLPQYVFMAWKGINLRLPLISTMSANLSVSLHFSDNNCVPYVHLISSMSVKGHSLFMLPRPFRRNIRQTGQL